MITSIDNDIRERSVFMDHDGNPEDLISLILLLGMKHIKIIDISITPADCYIDAALETNLKIRHYMTEKLKLLLVILNRKIHFQNFIEFPLFKSVTVLCYLINSKIVPS